MATLRRIGGTKKSETFQQTELETTPKQIHQTQLHDNRGHSFKEKGYITGTTTIFFDNTAAEDEEAADAAADVDDNMSDYQVVSVRNEKPQRKLSGKDRSWKGTSSRHLNHSICTLLSHCGGVGNLKSCTFHLLSIH